MSNFIKSYGNNPIRDFEINKLGMHQKLYIYEQWSSMYLYNKHWFGNQVDQGSTIGVCCVCAYTLFYWCTHDFGHVDLYANFFPMILKSFQNFYGSYYCYTLDF